MKRKLLFFLTQVIILTAFTFTTFSMNDVRIIKSASNKPSLNKIDTSYRIIEAVQKTYGYEISINNKILIRQLTIPGRPGNKGFSSKKDAGKVAALVIEKIKKGLMPPTVSQQELKKLRISI